MSYHHNFGRVMPWQLNDVLNEVICATKAPSEMVTSISLAAISTVVQHHCSMQMKPGVTGPISLYLITIAESGERKTGVQNLLFKTILEMESRWREEAIQKAKAHKVQHALWKEKVEGFRRALQRAIVKGHPSAHIEELLSTALDAEPQPIPARKIVYVDTTPEALLSGLNEFGSSAVLLHDEFGQFCDGPMARQTPQLNAIWSGTECTVDRKTAGSFVLKNAHLTCLLQAQPKVFERFMAKHGEQARGNGFLARALLACPASTQGTRFEDGSTVACPTLDWFYQRCEQLLNLREHRALRFSPQAQYEWTQMANYYEQQMNPGGIYFGARDFASKAAENTARIAASLHAFLIDDSDEVSSEMLGYAGNLMGWYGNQFLSIMGAHNPVMELERDLYELENWIQSRLTQNNTNFMPKSYLMQYGPNRLRCREKLDLLLGILSSRGRLMVFRHQKKWFIQTAQVMVPVERPCWVN